MCVVKWYLLFRPVYSCKACRSSLQMDCVSQFAEAGVTIANQNKALELLWSQKQELELELGQSKAVIADVTTDKLAVEAQFNAFQRDAKALKASMLSSGTKFSVKDADVLAFFHSL